MAFKLGNINQQEKIKKEGIGDISFFKRDIVLLNKAFSNSVKEDFYTELSVLLKAGITLKEALDLIWNSQKKKQDKDVLSLISQDILQGSSLSNALRAQKTFTDYEYYSIKIGEETGTLSKVSFQLGEFFSRKNEQRRSLIGALTYPIIILSTAALVVIFMLRLVVPMFQDIFKQNNVELPAITKFIISVSEFVGYYGGYVFLGILILITFKFFIKTNNQFRQLKDRIVLKLPFLGNFIKTVYLSQFTQAVSLLTASKVPMIDSVKLVRQMISFYPLQNALKYVEEQLLQGKSLSQSLKNQKLFDDKMIALVKVSEETNQTEFIFDRLNMRYNTQVQQQSRMLATLMEPVIILIVGCLVGVILVAMYLPMFKLSSVLG